MIGGLVGAGLNAAGLVERKGSDKAVQDIGPFENIMFEGPGMMGTVAKTPKLTLGNFGGGCSDSSTLLWARLWLGNLASTEKAERNFENGLALALIDWGFSRLCFCCFSLFVF